MADKTISDFMPAFKLPFDSEAVRAELPAELGAASLILCCQRAARISVLLLTDLGALMSASLLGYLLWAEPVLRQPVSLYAELMPLLLLFPISYASNGLYPGFGVGAIEILRRLSQSTSFTFLALAAASFAFKVPPVYSRMVFVLAWAISLVTVPCLRFLVLSFVNGLEWWREPAVLVGDRGWAERTIQALSRARSLGYRPVGVLSAFFPVREWSTKDVPILGGLELAPHLAEHGVRVALINEEQAAQDPSMIDWLQQYFRHVVIIRDFGGFPVERARVCNLGDVVGIEFTNNLLRWENQMIKRALDLVLGSLLLILAAPLILAAALLVRLVNAGAFFYAQEREGLGGRSIRVWKLRTMRPDADQRLEDYLSSNPAFRREWEEHFKLARDPRVVPGAGLFLRRFSVDELPQFLSVVKGEMSLVGPRPFPKYHVEHFPEDFRQLRGRVRPGLSGMWQVMVRSTGGIQEQIAYDTYYIRNWSIWLDLYILARTLFAVLNGRGAC